LEDLRPLIVCPAMAITQVSNMIESPALFVIYHSYGCFV